MFCKKCGYELPDDSEFCFKCGTQQGDNITLENTSFNKADPEPKRGEIIVISPSADAEPYNAPKNTHNHIIWIIPTVVLVTIVIVVTVIANAINSCRYSTYIYDDYSYPTDYSERTSSSPFLWVEEPSIKRTVLYKTDTGR